ncbi:MAG: VWA domain-containing protein, partial [Planctomycetes bacterium]|nr:VWA domain-containing protein [Planctomycetota bacterium]
MELHFLYPWLVLIAAALAVLAGALLFWKRKFAPFLLTLGAAAFFLSGARPMIGTTQPEVRHALVLDVSGSMEARRKQVDAWLDKLVESTELPPQHSFVRYELSDALREPGGAHGQATDYARLADIAADDAINGEIILVTDGQGPIDKLYGAVNPNRLILLRAPAPNWPDASVVSMTAPTSVAPGANVSIRASIRCDADAQVEWRMLSGDAEIATGTANLRAGMPAPVVCAFAASGSGLQRVRLVLHLPGDREPRNDQASCAFFTGDKRGILYCAPETPPGSDALLQTLQADDTSRVTVSHKLPLSADELDNVAVVVINNLSLSEAGATQAQLQALADWVNGGGNLLMAGTDGAFGPGGYRGSPLEPLMPVRFRPDDSPPRQLLLLLDVSSSMNDSLPGGGTKLARLKEAARRVLDSVGEDDRVAVAGFREGVRGEIDFRRAGDERLNAEIDGLSAQGSTHIGSSLQQAIGAFNGGDHNGILMITDGDDVEHAGENTFSQIAQRLTDGK